MIKSKLVSLFSGLLLVAACTNDEVLDGVNIEIPDESTVSSKIRTYDEALQIAKDASAMLEDDGVKTKSANVKRMLDMSEGVKAVVFPRTKGATGAYDSDTLMYVFNYEDNQGYVIVSANPATEGLIAVTESGHYDPAEDIENPGFKLYMELAKQRIMLIKHPPLDSTKLNDSLLIDETDTTSGGGYTPNPQFDQTKRVSEKVVTSRVYPVITKRWGQRNPEGWSCPNKISGCMNTAAFIIMSYFSYPSTLHLTYLEDAPTITIDWGRIHDHVKSGDTCNIQTHNQISYICREIGYRSNSNYYNTDPKSTGTTSVNIKNALTGLGYNVSSSKTYSAGCLANPLEEGWKALMFAKIKDKASSSDDEGDGHGWVVDGVYNYYIYTREYLMAGGTSTWVLQSESTTYYKYNHVNWGWNGLDNGYYSANTFDTYYISIRDYDNDYIIDYCPIEDVQYFLVKRINWYE